MTDGDRRFLAMLVASHKEVISEECRRWNLDKGEYFKESCTCRQESYGD